MKKFLLLALLVFLTGCQSTIKQNPVEYSQAGEASGGKQGHYLEFHTGQFIQVPLHE